MRGLNVYLFEFVFLTILITHSQVSGSETKQRRKDFCYRGSFSDTNSRLKKLDAKDVASCIILCVDDPQCKSVNYDTATSLCQISNLIYDNTSATSWKIVFTPGMSSWSLSKDGCSILPERGPFAVSSEKGRYQIMFSEAASYCAKFGSTVMTPTQLQKAFQDHLMHGCRCSWLSDGTSVYPRQRVLQGCGNRTGIIACSSTRTYADLLCYKN